jgi:hypothetical protein
LLELDRVTAAVRSPRGRVHWTVVHGLVFALETARAAGDAPATSLPVIRTLIDRLTRERRAGFDRYLGGRFRRLSEGSSTPPAKPPSRRARKQPAAAPRPTRPAPPSGPMTRVFVLAPGPKRLPPGVISRIGGPPVGVDDARWPRTAGPGTRRPMQHVLTLAAADLGGARLPGGAAAVALFVRDPDHNAASAPHHPDAHVRLLTAAALRKGEYAGELPPGSLPAGALKVKAVDVPRAVFDERDQRRELAAPRRALRRAAGFALGGPLWLQDPEHDGAFVLQFRSSLARMNLGDGGVMFVFSDTAFWQSS